MLVATRRRSVAAGLTGSARRRAELAGSQGEQQRRIDGRESESDDPKTRHDHDRVMICPWI
jgi:hypothetical protein